MTDNTAPAAPTSTLVSPAATPAQANVAPAVPTGPAGDSSAESKPHYANHHYNGKQYYNKNYNRQGYSGATNRPYNNQKKPYNQSQAGSSPGQGKYVPQVQHQNYNYGAYPQQMYGYGFVAPPYYLMVPNVPYGQGQYVAVPPGPAKVKLTTKDGKPVDLEEKKKESSSSTPVSSPAPVKASPVVAQKAPEVKAKANSAAEEFKRKIAEKAAAAKKEKEDKEKEEKEKEQRLKEEKEKEQKEKEKKEREEKEKAEREKEIEAKAESKVESAPEKVEPAVQKAEVKESTELKESTEPYDPHAKEPTEPYNPHAKEPTEPYNPHAKEPTEPYNPHAKEPTEPYNPHAKEPTEPYNPHAKEPTEPYNPHAKEPTEPYNPHAKEPTEPYNPHAKEPTEPYNPHAKESSELKEPNEPYDPKAESQSEEPTEEPEDPNKFSISKFLDRLSTATAIDDIYAVKYPEGVSGASIERKIEGKKYRYDPQFLVQFQPLMVFPNDAAFKAQTEIIDVNVFAKKASHGGHGGSRSKFGGSAPPRFGSGAPGGRGMQFSEGRQNLRSGSKRKGGANGSSRDRSTRKGNHSKRGDRNYRGEKDEEEQDPQITIPPEEIKPLAKSANRWAPRKKAAEVKYAPDGSVILSAEDVARKCKSLLNKLTYEMFDEITDELIELANQTRFEKELTTIQTILSLTFAKATDEPHWCKMYAAFCAKLISLVSNEIKDHAAEARGDERVYTGGPLARRILLTTCQAEYEKGWVDKLPTNEDGSPLEPEMMSDEYYAMAAAKRRGLGLVEFIGHLYNAHLLNDQVMFVCIRDASKKDTSEENLENFTKLLKTVGPNLDSDERKKAVVNMAFRRVDEILNDKDLTITLRSRFMLMDLVDLRGRKWQSTKPDEGPKTLQEIHRDAEIQKMEEQRAQNEKRQKRHNDSRSSSSRGHSNWNNSSGGNNHPLRKIASFANRDQAKDSRSGSGAGAPELQRETSKRSESSQYNRFAMLGDDDSNDNDEAAA